MKLERKGEQNHHLDAYRFSFGLVVFFAVMIVGSAASRVWHTGLWLVKTILWIVVTGGVFFIPNGAPLPLGNSRWTHLDPPPPRPEFYVVYAEIARIISVLCSSCRSAGGAPRPRQRR